MCRHDARPGASAAHQSLRDEVHPARRAAPLGEDGEPIDAGQLLARLVPGRVMAIVGPHGHGKSTLLAALAKGAARAGSATTCVRVRSPFDSWRPVVAALESPAGGLVACDGWERALPGTGSVVRFVAAARRLRFVVTAHGHRGVTVLIRCGTSSHLLARLVARLPNHGGLITRDDIDDACRRHAGDLREALYDLYDRFERRARSQDWNPGSPGPEAVSAG